MGNGLQINKLEFKPAKLVSGQATLLTINLQNMGSRDTEKAYVYLYGLSNEWYGAGSSLIGDFSSDKLYKVDVGGLRAANEELKTAGEKKILVWKLKSPKEELEGTEFTHKVFARVCYHYATDVLAKLEVVGENEWLLMEQTGKYSQHPISVKQTAAPIQINIESMQPVIVDQDMSFQIKVSNVGGGYAFFKEGTGAKDCSNAFDESTDANADVGLVMNNIKFVFGDTTCEVSGDDASNTVWLSKGQDRKFSVTCPGFSSDMPMKETNLQIQMTYDYYVDSEATAILVGVKGATDVVPTKPPVVTPLTLPQSVTAGNCNAKYRSDLTVISANGVCGSVNAVGAVVIPASGKEFVVTNNGATSTIAYDGKSADLPINGGKLFAKHSCTQNSIPKNVDFTVTQTTTVTGTNCAVEIKFTSVPV